MTLFQDYRAPTDDGSVFADPPIERAGEVLRRNLTAFDHFPTWLADLRRQSRGELIDAALRYTSAYRSVHWARESLQRPILMAGHQPSLFHPGVWFKNFALGHLAQQHDCLAINLVVDNDVCGSRSIRAPVQDPASGLIRMRAVAFDTAGGGMPYEQTLIRDRETFLSFGDRLRAAVGSLSPDPVITDLWPHAIEAINRCGFAGCALAQARHAYERDLGLQTLELPVSVAAKSRSFAHFVLHILMDPQRFRACYNESLADYRTAHGIRSSAHPVPQLAGDGQWCEVPLWVYSNRSPVRRQVWVRRFGGQLEIGDRDSYSMRIDVRDPESAVSQLGDESTGDFKLRPRALLTTMYARLVLSDLFLHGIGGGKYDQLGDVITGEFFGIRPPEFMVLSATVLLPGTVADDSSRALEDLKRQIRDVTYHPERFADVVKLPADLLAAKRDALADIPLRGQKHDWHHRLARINAELSASLAVHRESLTSNLHRTRQRIASAHTLASREHSFVIYPSEFLRIAFDQMLPTSVSQKSSKAPY